MVVMHEKTIIVVTNKALSLIGNSEQGQTSWFSKEKVMTFKHMRVESYDFDVILQRGMAYTSSLTPRWLSQHA